MLKLEDMETLWGIPVIRLKEYSKKYKFYFSLLLFCDAIIVTIIMYLMFKYSVDFYSYLLIITLLCLLINNAINYFLNPARWQAFKFFKANKNNKIKIMSYNLDEKTLYSILYCVGFKRLKQNKSFEDYKELLLSACCEDISNAKKVMKLLRKYENKSGTLIAYIMIKGNKEYFIDYKLDDKMILNEDEREEDVDE